MCFARAGRAQLLSWPIWAFGGPQVPHWICLTWVLFLLVFWIGHLMAYLQHRTLPTWCLCWLDIVSTYRTNVRAQFNSQCANGIPPWLHNFNFILHRLFLFCRPRFIYCCCLTQRYLNRPELNHSQPNLRQYRHSFCDWHMWPDVPS